MPKESNRSQLHLDAQDRARAALALHQELYAGSRGAAAIGGIAPARGESK